MTDFLLPLIALACPIGMLAMMVLPALGRRFARRPQSAEAGDPTPTRRDDQTLTTA